MDNSGFQSGLSALGKIGTAGLKVFAAGTTAAVAGLTALGTAAVNTFADFEQNIGGSEAVFAEYAEKLQSIASEAFENVGLSTSDYLATANKMGALFQGAGFTIEESLDLTSQSMQRAADVASIMGIDTSAAMEAIAGAAKGNFTMMDNLGVAMNDTTLQAYALEKGLQKSTREMTNQEKIGLAMEMFLEKTGYAMGNFSKEAATTIAGSMGMMKASWENLLVGVADDTQDFDTLVDNFVNSAVTFAGNVLPRIGTAIQGSFDLVTQLVPIIAEQLPGLVEGLVPQLLESGISIVTWLIKGIQENVPVLLEKGYELLQNLVEGFVEAIPEYLPLALDFIQQFGDKLAEKVPVFIQKGFELLSRLADGIVSAIPILVEKVPTIISTFANIINDNFPTILLKGAEIIGKLVMGLISAIPTIIANIPQIISAIVDTFMAFQWLNLGKNIIDFFTKGIDNMKGLVKKSAENIHNSIKTTFQNLPEILANFGKSAMYSLGSTISGLKSYIMTNALKIVSAIESTILQLPGKMVNIGGDIVRGLWNGISNMTGWIVDKVAGFALGIIQAAKDALGVASPSKEFKYIGEMCVAGYDKGMEEFAEPSFMTRKINAGLTAMRNAVDNGAYVGGSGKSGNLYQTINVNKEVSTADELARAIRLESRWGMVVRSVPVG